MKWNPNLGFDGRCQEAFQYYEKCLGAKIGLMMTYGESPMSEQTPVEWRNKIMHATLSVGDQVLTGGDANAEQYRKPEGFSVLLNLDDAAEADRIFQALAENGAIQLPLQKTFWAERFGMLVDQFGTPWMINCGVTEP